jgi:hypothetical protein
MHGSPRVTACGRCRHRWSSRLWLALLACVLLGHSAAGDECVDGVSLLALGDTGKPVGREPHADRAQIVVGRALERRQRATHAAALLLLGDNFYPDGLERFSMVSRIRQNLVQPYCGFFSSRGERWHEVAGRCGGAAPGRVPAVYAVLGNHDHRSSESAQLQRHAVREFIENWRMPAGLAQAYELGCGVSVVAFDSSPIRKPGFWNPFEPDVQPLVDALRASRGPWRILIAHHPLIAVKQEAPRLTQRRRSYSRRLARAIQASGVRIQLMISGHEHYLAADPEPAGAFLNLVAGAGSSTRSQPAPRRKMRFRATELGFAEIRLHDAGGAPMLHASLWGVPRDGASPARRLVGWRIAADGSFRRVDPSRVRVAQTVPGAGTPAIRPPSATNSEPVE